jgi:hypothetical protein
MVEGKKDRDVPENLAVTAVTAVTAVVAVIGVTAVPFPTER